MSLAAPWMLLALLSVPAAAGSIYALWRARRVARIQVRRGGGGPASAGRRTGSRAGGALLLAALALLAVAAARPQWGSAQAPPPRAADVVIALDASQSMAARDVQPSRWSAAAGEARLLLDARRGRRTALVIFGSSAYVRFPLTRDVDSAIAVLDALRPGESLVQPGSDIARAISTARGLLDGGAIVVISDGESHAGQAAAETAAREAADGGVRVYAAGVGTEAGAEVPLPDGGVKIDARTGAAARSRLDRGALEALAAAGGGRYVQIGPVGGIAPLIAELDALDAAEDGQDEPAPIERYQWFAGAALACLIGAALARGGLPRFTSRAAARAPGAALVLLAAAALAISGCTGSAAREANERGNAEFAAGRYAEALAFYRQAQAAEPELAAVHLNAGRALHALGEYDRAERATARAISSESAGERADAWFQIGNHRVQAGDLVGARTAYIQALRERSGHADAKINLELVTAMLPPEPEAEPGEGEPAEEGEASSSAAEAASESEPAEDSPAGESAGAGEPAGTAGAGGAERPAFDERGSAASARANLAAALDQLPLEDASVEQALAVLDALRAVPGQPLAAGALEAPIEGIDDW